jgi:hypothetical protein
MKTEQFKVVLVKNEYDLMSRDKLKMNRINESININRRRLNGRSTH